MIGYFVYHTNLKVGKVARADFATYAIIFYQDGGTKLFEKSAFSEGDLARAYLPLGTTCRASGKPCRIDQIVEVIRDRQPVMYLVTTEDGLQLRVSEVDLVPTEIVRQDPVTSLSCLQQEGYPLFSARGELVAASAEVVRQGGGLTALLSSRIDVRPHQAYVVGVILQDRLRRYILADEVGLGKTVEAGVIVQDLLSSRPDANVLVLCPGALTQQWLCEFYTKFSTRVFTLLDLHASPAGLSADQRRTVIAPMHAITGPHRKWLLEAVWDLVVVDEVHHLLISDEAYSFVKAISARAPSVLLLSALPAQQRKTEFLKLLALLEPGRYESTVPDDFDRLYDAQPAISRQLRRLRRRLEEELPDPVEIREIAGEILAIPALADDPVLRSRAHHLLQPTSDAVEGGWIFLRLAADRARINRRILRNRRARLVEDGLIDKTERLYLPESYAPGQPELDAIRAAVRLVRSLPEELHPDTWSVFGRVLMQSFAHPGTALDLLTRLGAPPRGVSRSPPESLGHLAGNAGWTRYRDDILAAVRPSLAPADIGAAIDAARLWGDSKSALNRVDELVEMLERLERRYKKLVVFAGFPGLVEHLLPFLCEVFEPESVCEFRSDMDLAEKEANVTRFRTDREAWLLVCDESGGEGRNFQFAGEVVHFDTPWYVSRIEQRIGRLDRLGRLTPEVPTCVLFARGTPEADVVRCFAEGFRVHEKSVSGFEFSLRNLELGVVRTLLGSGGLTADEFIPELSAQVEQERVREENEAVLDEASFNREAAERYRRSHTLADAEESLEKAFTEFLRKVATGNAARARYDSEFPSGIWELESSQFQHIKVDLAARDASARPAESMRGTFRRRIAQERPDLQFFSVGHPLFDGVINALRTEQCGRVYAIDIASPARPAWYGFEFVFVAGPNVSVLDGNSGLLNQANRLFTGPPVHVFIDKQGKVEPAGDELLALRRALNHSEKDRSWWNLTKQKAVKATLSFGGQDGWRSAVQHAATVALSEAKQRFRDRLERDIVAAGNVLDEQLLQTGAGDPGETAGLERVRQAIREWTVSFDAAGFLSVNSRPGRPQ